jgi:hypothetical protein
MAADTVVEDPALEQPGEIVPARLTLGQKLVAAALDIDSIAKSGYNQAQHYAFATAETLISDIRGPLLSRGVLVLAGEHETDERPRETRGGGQTSITTVHLEFTFLDVETGETLALRWLGRGEDPMDKGVGKALTNALKTFLRQQLLLPWGQDDPEADEGSDQRANGDTVNLIAEARGLSNDQLNQILVANSLPAQQAPFGAFTRVPSEKAEAIAKALKDAH